MLASKTGHEIFDGFAAQFFDDVLGDVGPPLPNALQFLKEGLGSGWISLARRSRNFDAGREKGLAVHEAAKGVGGALKLRLEHDFRLPLPTLPLLGEATRLEHASFPM